MTASRTILITGASRGIGATIARRLLAADTAVIGVGRDFSEWETAPKNFTTVELDLADLEGLPHRLGEIARAHPDIDGLILNAGYGRFGSLEEFSYRQIQEMVDVNLIQHIFVSRAFIPRIKKQGFGDLVVIGSEAALSGGPKGAVYSACKFALRGLTQSLRQECAASGMRVSLINPGMVKTGFFQDLDFSPGEAPENHIRPEDIAEAVVMIIQAHPGTVFDEINLSPLKKVVDFSKK
ncbi:MAG: short-chain dehydrogenase [Gammaproteobacteria bacterium (ex Lamellibrachia satsuma)]|nr:MAG: SDR family oxidoreductase [Gammaproteobacteria bacterium (ex Lamellibrachia satsuma)]RRS31792.1 MAG: short-chain dehydrogenase [Gammaproteobacteria bacterium (ex Lamellibrachia satsuma)]RRS33682.1 MAG: short-chain dehydrogenase [Gammaproteobacteria bacterium (ex Lamellibrachia satsuma)]